MSTWLWAPSLCTFQLPGILCPQSTSCFWCITSVPADAPAIWSCLLHRAFCQELPTPVSVRWKLPILCVLPFLFDFFFFPFLVLYKAFPTNRSTNLTCTFTSTKLKASQNFVLLQMTGLFKLWLLLTDSFVIISCFFFILFFFSLIQQIRRSYNYFISLMLI